MKVDFKIFLLSTLIILVCKAQNYTYYVFASEWTGTVCFQNNCTNAEGIDQKWFNIHGFWPTNSTGNGPSDCTNVEFNQEELSDQTEDNMEAYWSGLYSSAQAFHSHEWSKHGTCWVDTIGNNNQDDYFSNAISIALDLNVYQVLADAGIVPRTLAYTLSQVEEALETAFGETSIQCADDMIQTINVCLDLDYKPMNCPNVSISTGNNCYPEVFYLPLVVNISENQF
jgi:ribonuclease T2